MPEPGSGALNAGYAVTYAPDNGEKLKLASYFHEQNQRELDRQAQKQKDADAHKFALQKYYGDQFDPSKFDTKTALDDNINTYLSKGHQAVADAIQRGVDGADLEKVMQQSITPALQLYQKGSLIKQNIDAAAAANKEDKGLDVDAGAKVAMLRALYNKDADGNYTLKNDQELSQVDPSNDYFKDVVVNNPELVAKGGVDVESKFKSMLPGNFKSSGSYYSSPGVKRKGSFEASYFQGAQVLKQDPDGTWKVTTNDNPINTTDEKGNPVVIHQVPDEVLRHFQQTTGEIANMNVATMKYAQEHGLPAMKPGTQGFEQMKKAMLYDKIENIAPKRISETHDITAAPIVIKQQLFPNYDPTKSNGAGGQTPEQGPSDFSKINNAPLYITGGDMTVTAGSINNGKVDSNLVPMGEVEAKMDMKNLPEQYRSAAKKLASDNDITGDTEGRKKTPTGFVTVKLYDRQIVGIKTDKGNWLTPEDLGTVQTNELNKTLPMKQKIHPNQHKEKISW